MAAELNKPNHRYYQLRNHIKLPEIDMSKQWIYADGIRKIDNFMILPLFAGSTPGAWYDPSDLTTLFQDSAGTTPVTAAGQTVGLMLDKSQGLALGSELWSDTGVIVGTGWTAASGVYTHTAGVDTFRKDMGLVAGKTYQVTLTVTGRTAGNIYLSYGGTVNGPLVAANGTYTQRVASGVNGLLYFQPSTDFNGSVSGISVKLLAGNHATQATSTQRPIYGINPITGTRNLLTYTEQFDNAAWAKSNITISANTTTDPNGTSTADTLTANIGLSNHRVISSTATLAVGQSCIHSVYFKAGTYNLAQIHDGASASYFANFNLTSGTVASSTGCTATITPVGNGWYRCAISMTLNGANPILGISLISSGTAVRNETWTAAGTETVFAWGAQTEASATATAYQKVVSRYEVTEAGVQSVSYLAFDGVDDGMVTGTITPAIDKVQVFAGVRKLSTSVGIIAELSASADTNIGSFVLYNQIPAGFGFHSVGQFISAAAVSSGSTPPITNIVTGIGNIAGDVTTLRVNGTQAATSATDQGTGNYLAYPLYIGRRGGASLTFNGRIYSLIVRFGANLTAGQITSTESWVNSKTGAF